VQTPSLILRFFLGSRFRIRGRAAVIEICGFSARRATDLNPGGPMRYTCSELRGIACGNRHKDLIDCCLSGNLHAFGLKAFP
jgi:hypothetical protein